MIEQTSLKSELWLKIYELHTKLHCFVDIYQECELIDQLKIDKSVYILLQNNSGNKRLKGTDNQELQQTKNIKKLKFTIRLSTQIENSFFKDIIKQNQIGYFLQPTHQHHPSRLKKITYKDLLLQPYLLINRKTYNEVGQLNDGYILEEGDILKIGRNIFLVYEIYHGNRRSNITHKQQTYCEQNIYEYKPFTQGICKFCFEQQGKLPLKALVSPCLCKGSCGLVHICCLKNWIQRKIVKIQENIITYDFSKYFCEICKFSLPKLFALNGRIFPIFKQQFRNGPYIILQRVLPQYPSEFANLITNGQLHIIKPIGQHPIKIGRKAQNQLKILDLTVSREHLQIIYRKGSFQAYDCCSRFGTLVTFSRLIKIEKQTKLHISNQLYTFNQIFKIEEEIQDIEIKQQSTL